MGLPIKSPKITELFVFAPRSVSIGAVRSEIFKSHAAVSYQVIHSSCCRLCSWLSPVESPSSVIPSVLSIMHTYWDVWPLYTICSSLKPVLSHYMQFCLIRLPNLYGYSGLKIRMVQNQSILDMFNNERQKITRNWPKCMYICTLKYWCSLSVTGDAHDGDGVWWKV